LRQPNLNGWHVDVGRAIGKQRSAVTGLAGTGHVRDGALPEFGLGAADLAEIKNLTLNDLAITQSSVFDHVPIGVGLSVFGSLIRPKKHRVELWRARVEKENIVGLHYTSFLTFFKFRLL